MTLMDDELARLQQAERLAWAVHAARLALLPSAGEGAARQVLAGLAGWLARRRWVLAAPARPSAWPAPRVRGDAD